MEKTLLLATVKSWNPEKQRYEPGKSQKVGGAAKIDFGGITISLDSQPPVLDPADTGAALVLRKPEGVKTPELYVYEFRSTSETPKKYVIGKKHMIESPFFYFSNLGDLMGIQIYRGSPANHPEMLEINSSNRMGETPASPLL